MSRTIYRLAAACVAAVLAAALAGCGGGDTPPPPPPTVGSATIGAAGGTVDGPDGVQLVVPAGALDADVTIRIARNAAGAPALPEGLGFVPDIYEITPHNLRFALPVQVRLPLGGAATADAAAMAADSGGQWSRVQATFSGNTAVIERWSLSWFWSHHNGTGCTNEVDDPHRCSSFTSVLGTFASTTPPGGLTDFTTSNRVRYVVMTQPGTLNIDLFFGAPPDCRAGNLTVSRVETPFGSSRGTQQVVLNRQAVSVGGTFQYQAPVTASTANGRGVVEFLFEFVCTRDYRARVMYALAHVPLLIDIPAPLGAPVITQQPANVAVAAGSLARFEVLATAANGLGVTWERSNDSGGTWAALGAGSAISGGSRFEFSTQLQDNGAQLRARVCNGSGSAQTCLNSNAAALSVSPAATAPVFAVQPVDLGVVAGQTASFTASAIGTPPPAVRWQVAAAGSSSFVDVSGEPACQPTAAPGSGAQTHSTCTLAQTAVNNSGQRLRAVASNSAAPSGVPSNAATLTISLAPVAPSITQQPLPQTGNVGGSASFSVGASGTATLVYQWRLNGTVLPAVNGPFAVGACTGGLSYSNNNTTVTLTNLSAGCDATSIAVVVSNGVNPNAVSGGAVLTVNQVALGLSLLAGAIGGPGLVDGTGSDARLRASPIAVDALGNAYFNDGIAGRVRRVDPSGVVSTFTGTGLEFRGNDGGIAVDASGNLYFPERGQGNRILRMTPAGALSVWLGAADGWSNFIHAVTMDTAGNLYGAEGWTGQPRRIVRITPARVVSTFYTFADADTGAGAMAADTGGNVYAAVSGSLFGTLVRITPAGVLSILAGAAGETGNVDGSGTTARFAGIGGLTIGAGGDLFATDSNNFSIRRITLAGEVSTVSGAATFPVAPVDGAANVARYEYPGSIAAAPNGDLLIGDVSTLRRLSPSFVASTLAGRWLARATVDAAGSAARFRYPGSLVLDGAGNAYVADSDRIRRVTPAGTVSTLAVLGATQLALDGSAGLVAASGNTIWRVSFAGVATVLAGDPSESGYVDATGASARFGQILGLAVDGASNVYGSERINGNATIRRITPAGVVTTWAGAVGITGAEDGFRTDARFTRATGLAFDASGNLYVADQGLTLRRITPAGVVSTVAGSANAAGSADGTGAAARFAGIDRLAFDAAGNLWIGDSGALRRMSPAGVVATVFGAQNLLGVRLGSIAPQFNSIGGLAVRVDGRVVLTSEAAVLEASVP